MAIVTKTGAMGGATFSFDYDDVALRLVAVRVQNNDTRVLNIELPKGTFQIQPGGSVNRNLNPPQQEAFTLGSFHGNVTFNFLHREFFS